MITIGDRIDCCGVNELRPIQDYPTNPEQIVKDACKEIYKRGGTGAFLIFSDTGRKTAGKNLTKFIRKNRLGTVIKSQPKINPNSRHNLTVWVWALNKQNMRNFWNKTKTKTIYD